MSRHNSKILVGDEPVPLLRGAVSPYFRLLKILGLKYHATTRQQPTKQNGIITFKYNFPLKFSRFFAKYWWQSNAVQGWQYGTLVRYGTPRDVGLHRILCAVTYGVKFWFTLTLTPSFFWIVYGRGYAVYILAVFSV